MQSEAVNANVKAAANYPEDAAKVNNYGGYIKQQLFKIDKYHS